MKKITKRKPFLARLTKAQRAHLREVGTKTIRHFLMDRQHQRDMRKAGTVMPCQICDQIAERSGIDLPSIKSGMPT